MLINLERIEEYIQHLMENYNLLDNGSHPETSHRCSGARQALDKVLYYLSMCGQEEMA